MRDMRTVLSPVLLLSASLAQAFTLDAVPLAAPPGATAANLARGADGAVLVSWIERLPEGGHRLVFQRCAAASRCEPAREVARGSDWFVNWADFPALAELPDGSLWAHLLRKNGHAKYAYDAVLAHSRDGGANWSPLAPLHDDGSASEHGFVSLLPAAPTSLLAVWLDGRNTVAGDAGADEHQGHGRGAMTLRAATLDADRRKTGEWELDAATCDCCQTDAALGARGPLVVWRDRDPGELRDIQIARFETGAWTAPRYVHRDRWHMPACPVNGPAIAAQGEQAWVAWYTEADGAPSLRLARSGDDGDTFAEPLRVGGAETLGRADLARNAEGVWLSWLQEVGGKQSLWLARFNDDLSREHERVRIAELQGRGRATGVPRLLALDRGVVLLWSDVQGQQSVLRAALVNHKPD